MAVFSRRRTRADFSDEVQAHLDLEADRLIAEGFSPEEARDSARRAFGNVAIVKERFYETSRWTWLEQFAQDLGYASRQLRHSPAFVATTVATLAVALGLLTIAFTIFNAYWLRPLAVRDPSGLHVIAWRSRTSGGPSFRWHDYQALAARTDLFSAAVAEHGRFVTSGERAVAAGLVSANYFGSLAPAMALGRGLGIADEDGGTAAVLSHDAWTRLFDRDPGVLGRPIDLNGRPFTIVGVAGEGFSGLGGESPRDVWVLLTTYAALEVPALIGPNQPREIEIAARLNDSVTAAQAASALSPLMRELLAGQDDVRAAVRPQSSLNSLTFDDLMVLSPIFGAFVLVLVTACANVSNVMLARATARQREIAVRLSIGARRGRIVRQLLTEGLLLAVLAGLAGLVVAAWGLRAAMALLFSTLPPSVVGIVRLAPMTIDYRVFLFALTVATAATLLFGLLPALQASRPKLTDALHGQGGGLRRGARLRSALVIGQVAVTIVLVILAVTLARNGAAVGAIDLGFTVEGVTSVNVRGPQDELAGSVAMALAEDPRVAEVAVSSGNPLFNTARRVAAAPAGGSAAIPTPSTFASPEFFSILRIAIERGRGFSDEEARTAAKVAIVSASTASAMWPGEDPVGQTLQIEPPNGRPVAALPGYSRVIVVGVVQDVVSGMLVSGRDTGHIYLPTSVANAQAKAILVRGRTDRDLGPQAFDEIFKRAVTDAQALEAIPLAEIRDLQIYPLLAASWVGTLLGAVALVLSVSGLYGVLVYTLKQRTKEIGIRMALGATAGSVVRLVLGQSARLAGIGAAAGGIAAFAAMKALGAAITLRAVTLVDVSAFAAGVALVMVAATLAAYQPARRAARIDPSSTLRAE
jgi:predicted permease